MEKVLTDFVKALRNSNVRVSPAETLDAVAVIDTVGYEDKELLKKSLSVVLPKTPDEKEKFEICFEPRWRIHIPLFCKDGPCLWSKTRLSRRHPS